MQGKLKKRQNLNLTNFRIPSVDDINVTFIS